MATKTVRLISKGQQLRWPFPMASVWCVDFWYYADPDGFVGSHWPLCVTGPRVQIPIPVGACGAHGACQSGQNPNCGHIPFNLGSDVSWFSSPKMTPGCVIWLLLLLCICCKHCTTGAIANVCCLVKLCLTFNCQAYSVGCKCFELSSARNRSVPPHVINAQLMW